MAITVIYIIYIFQKWNKLLLNIFPFIGIINIIVYVFQVNLFKTKQRPPSQS